MIYLEMYYASVFKFLTFIEIPPKMSYCGWLFWNKKSARKLDFSGFNF